MPAFQLVGHRGAREEAPENTIAGFQYARDLGLDAVELDVRLSRDHTLVVIHDATVDRTTSASGPVADFTAAELAAMDARGSCPSWPEPVEIPTLDSALPALARFPLIQVEIKRDTDARMEEIARMLISAMSDAGLADRVILSSFEPAAIEAIARIAPQQRRALIGAYDSPSFLETALSLGCSQADISLESGSADIVSRAHEHGLRVVGFQCNSIDALERALDLGMDAATSDVPSRILDHLSTNAR